MSTAPMKWYRIVMSFEVEAENEDAATREANQICLDGVVESVTLVPDDAGGSAS